MLIQNVKYANISLPPTRTNGKKQRNECNSTEMQKKIDYYALFTKHEKWVQRTFFGAFCGAG